MELSRAEPAQELKTIAGIKNNYQTAGFSLFLGVEPEGALY
jgi:hypothetical protein